MADKILAYHGDPAVKAKYLMRVRAHAAADEIIHDTYWQNGKGCAVGCTLHSSNHMGYEDELGIPVALGRLEDCLFEGLRSGEALSFPARFLESAKVGADLSRVSWQFLHWLLTEELAGRDHPLVRDAVKRCADALVPLAHGEPVSASAASAASAARSAESAAYKRMADKLLSLMEAAPLIKPSIMMGAAV